jgi:hypothetical protein
MMKLVSGPLKCCEDVRVSDLVCVVAQFSVKKKNNQTTKALSLGDQLRAVIFLPFCQVFIFFPPSSILVNLLQIQ